MPSLTVRIINSHKNRKFSQLCKWVGLHYIGFSYSQPNWQAAIADLLQEKNSIFLQRRNLG
jgi:saccharopine dehydrogenase-like NADP-dependent oxidoreductase